MTFNGTTSSTEPALSHANEVAAADYPAEIGLIVAVLSIGIFLVSPILVVWICARYAGDDSSDSSGIIEDEHIHETRKRFIRKKIGDLKVIVKKEHLVEDDDLETCSESSGTSDAAEGPHLCLPPPDMSVGDSDGMDGAARKISNLCSICLSGYSVGETVVWSSNPDCPHGYHEECLVEWFLKQGRKETICPYCRRQFLEPDPHHRTTAPEGGEPSPSIVPPSPPTSARREEGECTNTDANEDQPSVVLVRP